MSEPTIRKHLAKVEDKLGVSLCELRERLRQPDGRLSYSAELAAMFRRPAQGSAAILDAGGVGVFRRQPEIEREHRGTGRGSFPSTDPRLAGPRRRP